MRELRQLVSGIISYIHCYIQCGGAQVEFTCTDCGTRVGGKSYILVSQNVLLEKTKDETRAGYLLTKANDVKNVPSGER